jgi:hypothetical protein
MNDPYETERNEKAVREKMGNFLGQCLRLLHDSLGVINAQREDIKKLRGWIERIQEQPKEGSNAEEMRLLKKIETVAREAYAVDIQAVAEIRNVAPSLAENFALGSVKKMHYALHQLDAHRRAAEKP